MSIETFRKFIKSVFEIALEKIIPPEEIAFKNAIKDFIIDFFVSSELYSEKQKANLSTELAISNYKDSFMNQMKISMKQMMDKHPEFLNEKYVNLLVSFFSMTQIIQFKLPELNADQKIQSAIVQKELLTETYLTTSNEKTEKLFGKHIAHLDWVIQKNTLSTNYSANFNLDDQNKVIEKMSDLIEQKVNTAFNKAEAKQIKSSGTERPILFPEALIITGYKERAFRQKIASGDIPHYKKNGKLQFLESELIDWVKEGKIKTSKEIKEDAKKHLQKFNRKK